MEALHSEFPFKTNMQIIPTQETKNIFKTSRNRKALLKKQEKIKKTPDPLYVKGYRRF